MGAIGRSPGGLGFGGLEPLDGAPDDVAPDSAREASVERSGEPARARRATLPFGSDARVDEIGPGPRKLPDPSGVAFHPERRTLYVVGDRGHVVEMTRKGEVLNRAHFPGLDLEAVTIGPDGRVFAAIEDKPLAIIELDPDTLEELRRFPIGARHDGVRILARHDNEGIEGLCWVEEEQAFYALNQSRPLCIVRLDVPLDEPEGGKARIAKVIRLDKDEVRKGSDLAYDAASGHFLVTASDPYGERGAVHEVTRKGKVLRSIDLPGHSQEGLALDDKGHAYITQDRGGILRIRPPKDR